MSRDDYRLNSRRNRIMSVAEFLEIKDKRSNLTYRISNGAGVYVRKGVEMSEKEVDELLPLPETLRAKENSDPKNNWTRNVKSF